MCSQLSTWPPAENFSSRSARQRSRAAKIPAAYPAAPPPMIRTSRTPAMRLLDLLQHRVGVADLELAGLLHVQRLHHPVVHQHRVALRAHPHPAGGEIHLEAQRLGERGA